MIQIRSNNFDSIIDQNFIVEQTKKNWAQSVEVASFNLEYFNSSTLSIYTQFIHSYWRY
ncbi:MAG: hypothetical protein R3Y52_04135 [Psittacicella sp.]